MSKARTLGNFVSAGNPLSDGTIAASEVTGLSTVATTGAYNDLSGKPSLGTAAAQNTATFLQTANNLSDVTAATARTNLGLATVAATGSYNDLSNKPTITTTATNIAGGSNGTIPYQSAEGTTQMLAVGTAGQLLQTNGAGAPSWVTPAPGAGTVTAVASGSLSDGSMVVLNSNGTVSVPAATAADSFQNPSNKAVTPEGTAATPEDGDYRNISACYNPNTNTIVVFYILATSFFLNAVSGTVKGGVITFGSPRRIYSNTMLRGTRGLHSACDTINNSFFCLYRYNGSTIGSHAWCRASGTTFLDSAQYDDTWGSDQPTGYTLIIAPTLNGANVQALIYYNGSSTGLSYVIACRCTAASQYLTIGTRYDLSSDVGTSQMLGCFGATSNIAAVPYRSGGGTVYLTIVTLNGTSATLSFQGQMSTDASSSTPMAVAYSSTLNRFMGLWSRSGVGDMRGSIFTLSGTTPTFGASTTLSGFGSTTLNINLVVDDATGFFYAGNTIYMARVTVTGTTFTTGNINGFTNSLSSTYQGNAIYDSSGLNFILPYLSTPVSVAFAQGFTSTLTSTNFLGVSNAAYTNGQTATIQTVGSTDNAQSGLTIGSKYYVTPSGTLSTLQTSQPYAGLALTATNLVVKG